MNKGPAPLDWIPPWSQRGRVRRSERGREEEGRQCLPGRWRQKPARVGDSLKAKTQVWLGKKEIKSTQYAKIGPGLSIRRLQDNSAFLYSLSADKPSSLCDRYLDVAHVTGVIPCSAGRFKQGVLDAHPPGTVADWLAVHSANFSPLVKRGLYFGNVGLALPNQSYAQALACHPGNPAMPVLTHPQPTTLLYVGPLGRGRLTHDRVR